MNNQKAIKVIKKLKLICQNKVTTNAAYLGQCVPDLSKPFFKIRLTHLKDWISYPSE